jgi:hypothetical protein
MTPDLGDIFTEPEADPDTLSNLGPLGPMAGTWGGSGGTDEHPVADGVGVDRYVERYDLQPIDPQTNGPQLLYGLRYHRHIVKPGEVETFHDQVGYWLWEPATGVLLLTIAIPRGQVALASGVARADATTFEVSAREGTATFGICSNPFLLEAFRTVAFSAKITARPPDAWSYEEVTTLEVHGRGEPFLHRDTNTLSRLALPTRNPIGRTTGSGLGIGSLSGRP